MTANPNKMVGGVKDGPAAPKQSVGPFSDLLYAASDACRRLDMDPEMAATIFELGMQFYIKRLIFQDTSSRKLRAVAEKPTGENNGDKSGGDPAA